MDKRPVDDLVELGRLLSSGTVAASGQLTVSSPESLRTIWQRLRTTYPADFTVSAREIADWHEFEADACEAARQHFAAEFHLGRLSSLRPGDQSIAERLKRVRQHLKNEVESADE